MVLLCYTLHFCLGLWYIQTWFHYLNQEGMCQLSAYCHSAPNLPFTACLWYWNISPLPVGTMLIFISRGCWRNPGKGSFSSWFWYALIFPAATAVKEPWWVSCRQLPRLPSWLSEGGVQGHPSYLHGDLLVAASWGRLPSEFQKRPGEYQWPPSRGSLLQN